MHTIVKSTALIKQIMSIIDGEQKTACAFLRMLKLFFLNSEGFVQSLQLLSKLP